MVGAARVAIPVGLPGNGKRVKLVALQSDLIQQWVTAGRLRPADVPRALAVAGVTPDAPAWRRFLLALLLWTGVLLTTAGVIFFFAYNWAAMHRFTKFAIAQVLLLAVFGAAAKLGLDRPSGQGALFGSVVLTGSLLALFGQTYQTGADPYSLFGIWAALVLPWVLIGRSGPLWLFWLALVNTTVLLYFNAVQWGLLGIFFGFSGTLYVLLALNIAAAIVWEWGIARGLPWLSRWQARLPATAAGVAATTLGCVAIVDTSENGAIAILCHLAWFIAVVYWYRSRVFDIFMLSGAALSAIVGITVLLSKELLRHGSEASFLLIGLIVIALSAGAGWWLRETLRKQPL